MSHPVFDLLGPVVAEHRALGTRSLNGAGGDGWGASHNIRSCYAHAIGGAAYRVAQFRQLLARTRKRIRGRAETRGTPIEPSLRNRCAMIRKAYAVIATFAHALYVSWASKLPGLALIVSGT